MRIGSVMRVPLFQVDAFTSKRFGGNPAAVMPLPTFLEDPVLQEWVAAAQKEPWTNPHSEVG